MADKEYIERNSLLDEVKQISGAFAAPLIIRKIESAPIEDVVEVKHGYWKQKRYEGGFMDGTNFEECSICRYRRYFDDIRFKLTFDYCPKCGAKMDLKEGEEE